jgi:predicted phage baseplate assembly protein
MSEPERQSLTDCGCCEGGTAPTPVLAGNRPGLSAIAYRAGTHAQFKRAMLAALSDANRPALAPLTTREDDDFAIGLLDAWATVADVLTFYQERIANESYLRTATERRSVLELARTIGYELRPGVAASTYLAFTLEDKAGAPGYATLDRGVKVQSVPGPNEKPQTFETVEPLAAKAVWNELQPRQTELVPPAPKTNPLGVYLKGVATILRPGDGLLLVHPTGPAGPAWAFRRVKDVMADKAGNFTQVTWKEPLTWRRLPAAITIDGIAVRVYALRQRAALFGHNAPDWRSMAKEVRLRYLGLPSTADDPNTDPEWPGLTLDAIDTTAATATGIGLRGQYFTGKDFNTLVLTRLDPVVDFTWTTTPPTPSVGSTNYSVRWRGQLKPRVTGSHFFETVSDDGVRLAVNNQLLIDNWTDHAATTDRSSFSIYLVAGRMYELTLEYYQGPGAAVIQLKWLPPGQTLEIIPQANLYPAAVPAERIYLDAVYAQVLRDSWLVLATPDAQEVYQADDVAADSRSGFALSAKTTRIRPRGDNLSRFNLRVRDTVVFAQSEELLLAERPLTTPVGGDAILLERPVEGLEPGRRLIVRGQVRDPTPGSVVKPGDKGGELVILKQAVSQDGRTRLELRMALQNTYDRPTVTITANVVPATHGEIVREVLGSGDAGKPYQHFTLREAPLTFTSSNDPSGGETTLQVYVNDLKWQEVPTLFGRDRWERIYVTRRADDGKTTVQFGDGHAGARPPTGQENIRAVYRKGVGREGQVKADQLTLLMTRPLGVKAVTNPVAAAGVQDPQALADARRNAPFTVLTLDRVVSLRDYEDFARAFAGIAKAHVAWTWVGHARGVFVTVAGPNGDPVPEKPVQDNLVAALGKAGDPRVAVRVRSYRRALFRLAADVTPQPDAVANRVLADVTAALRGRFGFEVREFGQPVPMSEVVAVMQNVPGVEAVRVRVLQRVGGPAETYLATQMPRDGDADAGLEAAELLTLDPAPLDDLKVVS